MHASFDHRTLLGALAALIVLAACEGEEGGRERLAPLSSDVTGPLGSIAGRAVLLGDAPELAPLVVAVNQDVCGGAGRNNRLEVGPDGGLAGVVVFIEPVGGQHSSPVAAQTMDQVACVYSPRVIAATPGSVVRFVNSDPTRHNVRIEDPATGRMLLNVSQEKGKADEWKIPGTGSYTVLCDYHPWMNATVVGVPGMHYAVTAKDGSFTIDSIPAGRHNVRLWMNGVEMRPKIDNRGQLIGYAFSDDIEKETSVVIAADSTTRIELPVNVSGR